MLDICPEMLYNTCMIKYSSINQFRHAVKKARTFYDSPTVTYIGTVKLHGTNSSVIIKADGNIVTQSRNRILTVDSDNAGFARFIDESIGHQTLVDWRRDNVASDDRDLIIYGEWCGRGIQKGVGISNLPKMFVIFQVGFVNDEYIENVEEDEDVENVIKWSIREKMTVSNLPQGFYNIYDFPYFEVEIDFNSPESLNNDIIEMTMSVENECPVYKQLTNETGIGEGIVWTPYKSSIDNVLFDSDMMFKTKGEKHSATKVKTLAPVDVERVESINEFIDSTVTETRINQAIEYIVEMGLEPSEKTTGDVIRWINGDIWKEEADTIKANGFDRKEIGSPIARKAKNMYWEVLSSM